MAPRPSPEVTLLKEFIKNYLEKGSPSEKGRCLEKATHEVLDLFESLKVEGKLKLVRCLYNYVHYNKVANKDEKEKIAKIGGILLESLNKYNIYGNFSNIVKTCKERGDFNKKQVPEAIKVLEEAGKRELIKQANAREKSEGRITPEDLEEKTQVPRAEKVLEEAGKRELIKQANAIVGHEISAGRITPEDLKAAREAGFKGAQKRIDALLGRRPRNGEGSSSSQNSRRSGSGRPPKVARRV